MAHTEQDAATRAAARKLAEDGVAALQSGDAKGAAQKLHKAFRMLLVPSVGLWSALQDGARAEAEKEIEQLRARIPNLVVVRACALDLCRYVVAAVLLLSVLPFGACPVRDVELDPAVTKYRD